jgi:hypothetical protein
MRSTLSILGVLLTAAATFAQPTFRITFDPEAQAGPYTGRVYIALNQNGAREPRLGMTEWFNPPPLYAADVRALPPGGSVVIDGQALHHPTPLADLAEGEWRAQAVARRSLDSPDPGQGPGDLYSEVRTFSLPAGDGPIELVLTETVEPAPFPASDDARLFELVSPLLSEFHGREFKLRAGVILPDGWEEEPDRHYPAVYIVPGFGGDHHAAPRMAQRRAPEAPSRQCVEVILDPSCFRGHSVFADSANNGPWGSALVEEFIPALEAAFRGPLDPNHRYVTGGSSGGWSSLWLQVTYPDSFAGCWSHVPDPVDFRDFQRIDLYAPGANMYTDPDGNRRPLARRGDKVLLYYDDFVARETVLGPGGQIHSFEACFSPRGEDGEPLALFNRATGAVDHDVALAWEPYDIRLVLERRWDTLGPKLAGKLHIYAGEVDTFYLEGAVALLKPALEGLGSDAEVEIIPGMAHETHTPGRDDMYRTILANWARVQPPRPVPAGD